MLHDPVASWVKKLGIEVRRLQFDNADFWQSRFWVLKISILPSVSPKSGFSGPDIAFCLNIFPQPKIQIGQLPPPLCNDATGMTVK